MYKFKRSERLKKILKKFFKKDKRKYEAILNKINEIMDSENPNHYKNLRYDLKEYKRVHVCSHFILVFKVIEDEKIIRFLDFDHHDKIYQRGRSFDV